MRHPSPTAALLIPALLLALGACSTAPPVAVPAAPVSPAAHTSTPTFGLVTAISPEPSQTRYTVQLTDGSQRSARSAQPFAIGACVELLADASVRESTRCK